jgi:hypothetical protein
MFDRRAHNIALISAREISTADRDRALGFTKDFLTKIDVRSIEKLRQGLELPPEALGFLIDLYIDKLAGEGMVDRSVMPLHSGKALKPQEKATIRGELKRSSSFRPERVFVSGAGTSAGAADWVINDVRVDGKTQFIQDGDVPGDMFASNAIDGFVSFQRCEKEIEMDVTYIGSNESGVPFYASVVGAAELKHEAKGER